MTVLEAQIRDGNVSPLFLRKQNKIPAIYYGHGEKNMSLQLDYQAFRKAYIKAGTNQVVELNIGGKKKSVLIHEVKSNPVTDAFQHVDFLHVNMDEEVTTMIPIELVGVAPAVKDLGGVLTTLKDEIEVTCLPFDLPQSIKVDISGLSELYSSVHVKDLLVPKEVKISSDPQDTVVSVVPPRAEEEKPQEVTAPVTEVATAQPEVAPSDKKE